MRKPGFDDDAFWGPPLVFIPPPVLPICNPEVEDCDNEPPIEVSEPGVLPIAFVSILGFWLYRRRQLRARSVA